MRRRPSVLLVSILLHGALLVLLATADMWSPITNWPTPHEVLAFSEKRLVRIEDIELPRPPHASVANAPATSAGAAISESAPVVPPSGVEPETTRQGGFGSSAFSDSIDATGTGAIEGIGPPSVPPPPPQQPVAPIRLSSGIRAPEKIVHVAPAYPALARASRVQGVVIIEAIIDSRGNVESARLLRSIALLDQAALDAVHQWKFTPTRLNGVAVPIIMTVTVNFKLSE
jgi:periplasmic protein TonB